MLEERYASGDRIGRQFGLSEPDFRVECGGYTYGKPTLSSADAAKQAREPQTALLVLFYNKPKEYF